jgi:hypothetical protein
MIIKISQKFRRDWIRGYKEFEHFAVFVNVWIESLRFLANPRRMPVYTCNPVHEWKVTTRCSHCIGTTNMGRLLLMRARHTRDRPGKNINNRG